MTDHRPTRRAFWIGGLSLVGLAAAPISADAQSVSLNFSFGSPGYNVGFWAPPPYYRRYYSPPLRRKCRKAQLPTRMRSKSCSCAP